MTSTIETGIRISGESRDFSAYWEIARTYGSWHFQINSLELHALRGISETVREEFGRAELSYYLGSKDHIGELLLDRLDALLQVLTEFRAKFLVIPFSSFRALELCEVSSSDIIQLLVHEAEERHFLLCLEATVDDEEESETAPASLLHLKETYPSHFFLFSINIDGLKKVPSLPTYTRVLRASIATVHLQLDKRFLRDTSPRCEKDELAALVGHLYWLPFKQQPLVFTNPLEDLEDIYKRFYAIVNARGYWYN